MIALRDVPGVQAIENRVTLNRLTGIKHEHDLDRMVEEVTRSFFGIEGPASWHIEWVDDDDEEGAAAKTETQFWREAGWDITDGHGKELECLPLFTDAMACVTEGWAGRPMLELEAEVWAVRKAPDVGINANVKAQNQNFLTLGKPRRKPAA